MRLSQVTMPEAAQVTIGCGPGAGREAGGTAGTGGEVGGAGGTVVGVGGIGAGEGHGCSTALGDEAHVGGGRVCDITGRWSCRARRCRGCSAWRWHDEVIIKKKIQRGPSGSAGVRGMVSEGKRIFIEDNMAGDHNTFRGHVHAAVPFV